MFSACISNNTSHKSVLPGELVMELKPHMSSFDTYIIWLTEMVISVKFFIKPLVHIICLISFAPFIRVTCSIQFWFLWCLVIVTVSQLSMSSDICSQYHPLSLQCCKLNCAFSKNVNRSNSTINYQTKTNGRNVWYLFVH